MLLCSFTYFLLTLLTGGVRARAGREGAARGGGPSVLLRRVERVRATYPPKMGPIPPQIVYSDLFDCICDVSYLQYIRCI